MSDKQTFYAQINDDNIVTNLAVVTAEFMAENPERYTGTWVETFYDLPNKIYCAIGYTYDYETQDFTAPYFKPIVIDE